MPNLKELKTRISSVKSTQKITKAMKLVSAAKLRRARERAEAAAPYAEKMQAVLVELASNVPADNAPELLVGRGADDVHLLVVITSDRGLCGGFNASLLKGVRAKIAELEAAGKSYKFLCLGKKGIEILEREYPKKILGKVEGISKKKKIDFEDAADQAHTITELFEQGKFDVCTIFYNKFISAINQEVTPQQVIPLSIDEVASETKSDAASVAASYDYEPSEEQILKDLLPRNLAVQIFHALLENQASEHGARMSAMDNATRNAGEMIKKLTLVYNRSRQATITKELIEIISGADAV